MGRRTFWAVCLACVSAFRAHAVGEATLIQRQQFKAGPVLKIKIAGPSVFSREIVVVKTEDLKKLVGTFLGRNEYTAATNEQTVQMGAVLQAVDRRAENWQVLTIDEAQARFAKADMGDNLAVVYHYVYVPD